MFSAAAVLIGFAQTEVTVPETDAGLGLDLQVLEGVIAPELGDIVVRVDTQDRTATGELTSHTAHSH